MYIYLFLIIFYYLAEDGQVGLVYAGWGWQIHVRVEPVDMAAHWKFETEMLSRHFTTIKKKIRIRIRRSGSG
jgi:hypothetical protein